MIFCMPKRCAAVMVVKCHTLNMQANVEPQTDGLEELKAAKSAIDTAQAALS